MGVLSIGEGCTTAKLMKRKQSQTLLAEKILEYTIKHKMLSKLELKQEKTTDSQFFLQQSLSYGERVKTNNN